MPPDQPPVLTQNPPSPLPNRKLKIVILSLALLLLIVLGAVLGFSKLSLLPKSSSPATPATPSNPQALLAGRIIYIDSNNLLKIYDFTKGTDTQLLPLEGLTKNNIKLVHSVIPSPDRQNLLIQAYNSDDYQFKTENLMYFVSSIDGQRLSRIDINKITRDLKFPGYVDIKNWASQKNSIIFTIINRTNQQKPQTLIGEYDLDTGKITELHRTPGNNLQIQFYDPTANQLFFFDPQNNGLQLVNTATKETQSYNLRHNINNIKGLNTYLASNSFAKLNELNIYSVTNPTSNPTSISISGISSNSWVIWSPQNNFLAVVGAPPGSSTKNTYVYDKSGKQVAIIPGVELWQGSLFSDDEKKLLVIYYKDSTFQSAKVVDIGNKGAVADIKLPIFFSDPVLWLK